MTRVELRRMRWTDIPAVHEIERRAFPATAWSVESFWSELAGVPGTRCYLVATDGERTVGYAGLMAVGAEADVQTLAVASAHRGRGVGAALLEALADESTGRGCTSLMLEVEAGNEPALALYRGHGFDQLARRSSYYGPGRDAVVMRRSLPGSEKVR